MDLSLIFFFRIVPMRRKCMKIGDLIIGESLANSFRGGIAQMMSTNGDAQVALPIGSTRLMSWVLWEIIQMGSTAESVMYLAHKQPLYCRDLFAEHIFRWIQERQSSDNTWAGMWVAFDKRMATELPYSITKSPWTKQLKEVDESIPSFFKIGNIIMMTQGENRGAVLSNGAIGQTASMLFSKIYKGE